MERMAGVVRSRSGEYVGVFVVLDWELRFDPWYVIFFLSSQGLLYVVYKAGVGLVDVGSAFDSM